MTKEIWFDMDGTIADLYGVNNWLEKIIARDESPYKEALPLVNLQALARVLNRLARQGYKINIISWLAKDSTKEYDEKVKKAKKEWLKKHLATVKFSQIDIVEYGTPKQNGRDGILFDDEIKNRQEWRGIAYNVDNILETLKAL